jgi:hypothetical protein
MKTFTTLALMVIVGTGVGTASGAQLKSASDVADIIILSEKDQAAEAPQMDGFPIVLPPTDDGHPQWNMGGLVLADLDNAGGLEVVYSSGACGPFPDCENGTIHVWDNRGNRAPGFPVEVVGGAFFAPSIDDMDGDGDQEIVQVTIDNQDSARIYVLSSTGSVLPGFPVVLGRASIADGATLHDLDLDGTKEIVYSTDSELHVIEVDGSEWGGAWPHQLIGGGDGTPAVGDVDNDGEPEIFTSGLDGIALLEADGSFMAGWPRSLYSGETLLQVHSSAVLGDIDGDSDLEIVVAGGYEGVTTDAAGNELRAFFYQVHVLHHDGSQVASWPRELPPRRGHQWLWNSPLITDLEGDGIAEIVIGHSNLSGNEAEIYAWDSAGELKAGFPFAAGASTVEISMLTAADIDGDGAVELFGDSFLSHDNLGWVHGVQSDGTAVPGFPLRPIGESDLNGAVIDDVDHDGDYELGAVTLHPIDSTVRIYLYDLAGSYLRSHRDWPTYHAANSRGGLAKSQYRGWRYRYAGSRIAKGR